MSNRILRNIAVTIGAGLAIGGVRRLPRKRVLDDAAGFLNPLLTRLETIENRVARVERADQPGSVAAPEEIEALGTLMSSQREEIESLRQQVHSVERRSFEHIESFTSKIESVQSQVPNLIESRVMARMTELEAKLRGEFDNIHTQTVDAFVQAIEHRVVGRISTIEGSLVSQSEAIVALRDKSATTDDRLQKLLEAVEKLVVRAETQSNIPLLPADGRVPVEPKPVKAAAAAAGVASAAARQVAAKQVAAKVAAAKQAAPSPSMPVRPTPARVLVDPSPEPQREVARERDSFQQHLQRELAKEAPKKEPALASAATAGVASGGSSRGMKSLGFSMVSLAVFGLRFIR